MLKIDIFFKICEKKKLENNMERDAADLIDKLSISRLKSERIGNDDNHKEFIAFTQELSKLKEKYSEFNWDQAYKMMTMINSTIWFLEAELKSGKDCLPNSHYLDDDSNVQKLALIGKNSIIIRNINGLRIQFKNFINSSLKEGFIDQKQHHLSE